MENDGQDGNAADNAEQQQQPGQQQGSTTGADQTTTTQQGQQPHQQPPKWALDRIGEISRQRRDAEQRASAAEARAAELERQLAGSQQGQDGNASGTAPVSQRAIEEMAARMADQRFSQRQFQEQSARIEGKGRQEFKDFDSKMDQFQLVGGIPKPLFDVVSQFDNAHQLLYALGSDLDLAASVVNLDPVSMAVKVAKLSGEVEQRLMSAGRDLPAPIEPIGGRSGGEKDPDKMTEDEWFEWRERTARR